MKIFKRKKTFKLLLTVLIFIWVIGSGISFVQFRCIEPITTAIGVSRVLFLKEEMVTLQYFPKVILMTPQGTDKDIELLNEKMEKSGYKYRADLRMGAGHAFVNSKTNKIMGAMNTVNGYYSLWVFNGPRELN